MRGLRHHLCVRSAGLDERRDQFVADVVNPVMIKSEFVPGSIECRLQSIRRNRKCATMIDYTITMQHVSEACAYAMH